MKIAFIMGSFPCLSETFILSQITGLLEAGNDLHIMAEVNPHESIIHLDVRKYALDKRTIYFPVPTGNKGKRRLFLLLRFIRCAFSSPCKTVRAISTLVGREKRFSYSAFYYAYPFLKRSYDIVHCHFGTEGHIGVLLKSLGLCKHLVVSFYGYDVSSFIKQHGKECYRELFQAGDRLLVLSRDMKNKLIELGANENKIQIHHLGADSRRFVYRERTLSSDRPIRILSVARLTEKKGLQYSIKAVSRVIHKNMNRPIQYFIAGEGQLRKELEGLIAELGMQRHIFLLGAKDQNQLRELYDEADIFVLTSVTAKDGDQEGTPTVLTEALCCGIPVVSTYHAGIPDIIIDGESGFLVPEKDLDALEERLSFLVQHSETWAQMGRKGKQHFSEEFDVNRLNKKLGKIYEELMRT